MGATEEMQLPTLGQPGSECRGCGWPLATDQRYCLNCGHRRAQPHVEYLDYLTPTAGGSQPPSQPAEAVAAQPPARPPGQRDYAPLAAVAGITILGVMLLIGVLIGRGSNDPAPAASVQPQVVTVEDGGTGGAGGDSATASATPDKPAGSGGDNKPNNSGTGDSGDKPGGDLTAGNNNGSDAPVQASTEDLEALQDQSGENYAEQSANLPDVIATPGEAPPTDNEDPGGGSSATTIK